MPSDYEAVIGLEIHARIKTKTKMFCPCSNNTWKSQPNTHTCPICTGFPGSLPSINSEAVRLGVLTGLALGCHILPTCKFDRKSYFYPDLPCGYQISQYDQPLAEEGRIAIWVGSEKKHIRLTRLHLENDAGKLTHTPQGTLVDLNRAGSPLMEMVTEPDFRTSAEVSAFLKELQRILRLVKSSDADMEKGMMRCDVNISIRKHGTSEFGTKVEIKNMNSFSNIEKAIEYEIKRQTKLLENSETITQETRGWHDQKQITLSQRTKEHAMDYRYFPEPDLPPLTFEQDQVEHIRASLPELPSATMERFHTQYQISLGDAEILVQDADVCAFFEQTAEQSHNPKKSANWVLSEILGVLNESGKHISELPVTPAHMAELITLIDNGKISGKIAKEVFAHMLQHGGEPTKIVQEKGLSQISNESEITGICEQVLQENQSLVDAYKNGKTKLFGSFVGQVMKKTQGKANPQMVNQVLKKLLA